jgi:hypothetical protein
MRTATLACLLATASACRAEPPPAYRLLGGISRLQLTDPPFLAALGSHGLDVVVFDGVVCVGGSLDDFFAARDCLFHHEHSARHGLNWFADVARPPDGTDASYDRVHVATIDFGLTPTRRVVDALEDEGVRVETWFGGAADVLVVRTRDGPRAWATLEALAFPGVTIPPARAYSASRG